MCKGGRHEGCLNTFFILFAILAFLPFQGGCIYIPTPAVDLRSERGVVGDEVIKSLKRGESTRADVLLLLGDPDERREQDRFFIYSWRAEEGIVATPIIGGTGGAVVETHFLCIEFNENNQVKRHAHFKSTGPFKDIRRVVDEKDRWLDASGD